MTEEEFVLTVRRNPVNAAILARLPALGTAQTQLVAGSLFQTVWNCLSGHPPGAQIHDYDIFYWDDDLSYGAEDDVIRRATRLFGDLDAQIEVRNQARVHVWFPERTGRIRPPLRSVTDGIDQFLVECTCVGVNAAGHVYAPHGLGDLVAGRLHPNSRNHTPDLFAAKAESYVRRWPWLQVLDAASPPA